ncbi:unnamed protein product [Closterium sp. Naga37s-1]|nr:unnamed protein product [Closterium sp. Naga37s-1]
MLVSFYLLFVSHMPIALSLLRFGCVADLTGLDGGVGIAIAWWIQLEWPTGVANWSGQLEWPTGEDLIVVCEGISPHPLPLAALLPPIPPSATHVPLQPTSLCDLPPHVTHQQPPV